MSDSGVAASMAQPPPPPPPRPPRPPSRMDNKYTNNNSSATSSVEMTEAADGNEESDQLVPAPPPSREKRKKKAAAAAPIQEEEEDDGNEREAAKRPSFQQQRYDRPPISGIKCWDRANMIISLVFMGVTAAMLGVAMYFRFGQSDYTLTVHLHNTVYPIWNHPANDVSASLTSNTPLPLDFLVWAAMAATMLRHAMSVILFKCCRDENKDVFRFRNDWTRWSAHVATNTLLDINMIALCGIVGMRELVAYGILSVFMHSAQVAHEYEVTGYSNAVTRFAPFLGSAILFAVIYGMSLYSLTEIHYPGYALTIMIYQGLARIADLSVCAVQWINEGDHSKSPRGESIKPDTFWNWNHNELAHTIIEFLLPVTAYVLLLDKSKRPIS